MKVRRVVIELVISLCLAACATHEPAAARTPAHPIENFFAPLCDVKGCCQGHGQVAYVQPDKAIMCTDGSTSDICDCH